MVEREPSRAVPLPTEATQRASKPEFGKITSLESPLRSAVLDIPKTHRARPDHQQPHSTTQPTDLPARQGFINPSQPQPAVQKHPLYPSVVEQDVVEIPKPLAPTAWTSKTSARPATYSSLVVPSTGSYHSWNQPKLGRYGDLVDLTDTALFEDKFGAPDPYDYVDAKKAEENIKALLAGALEDEEDMPRTRGRKKKLNETVDSIKDKLNGLNVNTEVGKIEVVQEDEDEVDEDDGTVEGLKIKLLPHQVNGVEWMRDKETGLKKQRGVLPKGGILADDVRRHHSVSLD